MSANPIMDEEHKTNRGEDGTPRSINNRWDLDNLYEGDMDAQQPMPRRRQLQTINNRWGGGLYEGDLGVSNDQPTPRRSRTQATNSHWGGPLVEGELVDFEQPTPRPRRRQPQAMNSHWANLVEDGVDNQSINPTCLANQQDAGPAETQTKAKSGKMKKYALKKPKFSKVIPVKVQVKYRDPYPVARIVCPDCADHTMTEFVRPGTPARPKSPLSEVTNADDDA